MLKPPLPPNEPQRLATLYALKILDTPPEERFDRITRLAVRLFGAPISLISLLDENRQWFKSCYGLDVSETPRELSFCGHAILGDDILVVPNVLLDERFSDNPLVTGDPHIRFYAGQPLSAPDGSKLGTLCIIDQQPHELSDADRQSLKDLAGMVETELTAVNIALLQWEIEERKRAEEDLRRFFTLSIDMLCIADFDGYFTQLNPAWEKTLGFTNEEMITRPFLDFVHPNDREATTAEAAKIATGSDTVSFENRYICKDGSYKWFSWVATPFIEQGLIYATARDITEYKRVEAELEKLSLVASQTDNAVIITDRDGFIEWVNDGFYRITGYTLPEVIGKKPGAILQGPLTNPDTAQRVRELLKSKQTFTEEILNYHKKGHTYWLSMTITPILDEDGEVERFIAIESDITQRKQAEAALKESEEQYRDLFENANDLIQSVSPDGRFLYVNRAWRETLGYSEAEIHKVYIYDIIHPDSLQHCMEVFQRLMTGGAVEDQIQAEFITKNRVKIFVEGSVNCRFVDGKPESTRGIFRDITERIKVDKMKNEFISTVSHELRTPLTSISGSLGLIAGGVAGELPNQAKAMIDIAHRNSERLVNLINDILDMEKIASGKMDFHLTLQPLIPLIEQAIEANQAYAEKFGVHYVLAQGTPDVWVNVDSNRLMQVFANLLSNAAKFSPSGEKVLISVERRENAVRVSVTDRGPGIPEEFRARIFTKFSQADSTDARQKGGTGLGLSIAKAIVEKLGGTIGFDTEIDVSTTFYFDLPLWHSEAAAMDEGTSAPDLPRILICEDDQDAATLLSIFLNHGGFQTDIAYDATSAKQLIEQHRYAAITIDIMLPDQDGISLIRELRQDECTRTLPIIVVSASADRGRTELNGDAFGIIDWMDKPIDRKRLVSALQDAVAQRENGQARILHIEDDPDVLKVVSVILRDQATVVPARNLQEAKQRLKAATFDLIILDVSLPDGSGLSLLPLLQRLTAPPIPVIVFSAQDLDAELAKNVKATLVKSRTSNDEFLETIRSLIERNRPGD